MQNFHKVSTTGSERATRQTAAELRGLGLDASAEVATANGLDIWDVTITYPEGLDLVGYLVCLEILEDMVSAAEVRLS